MKEAFPKNGEAWRPTEGFVDNDLFKTETARGINHQIEGYLEREAIEGGIKEALDNCTLPAGIHTKTLVRSLAAGLFALGLQVGDVFAQTGVEKPPLTQEQIVTVGEVTGIRPAELRESFTVEMSVKPGDGGKYIIHIGQIHQHPTQGFEQMLTSNMVGSAQRGLEGLIRNIYRVNQLDGVFEEGIASTESIRGLKERIRHRMTEIEKASKDTPFTIKKIETVLRSLIEVTDPILLSYVGGALDSLIKEYRAIIPTLQPSPTENIKLIELLLNLYDTTIALNLFQSTDPYVTAGASVNLYIRGEIANIYPAETSKANAHGIDMFEKQKKAEEEYFTKRSFLGTQLEADPYFAQLQRDFHSRFASARKDPDGTIVEEERGPLAELLERKVLEEAAFFELNLREEQQALRVAKEAFHEAAHRERNRVLLELIEDQDLSRIRQGLPLGNVVVVYGRAHDFTQDVVAQRQGDSPHRPVQRGLIKITPNTTK